MGGLPGGSGQARFGRRGYAATQARLRVDDVPVIAVFLIDAVLTVAFAAIGRASHDESLDLAGIAQTAWPFLVGLIVGWLIATMIAKGYPLTWRTAWPIWILTVAVGMLLRAVTNQGTATAFIIVATLTLGVLLLGWRLLAHRSIAPATHEPVR